MAVYKLFPEKDTTIYSGFPVLNTGLNNTLELSNYINSSSGLFSQTSRFLIQFSQTSILDIINNKISGNTWDAYLKLYLSDGNILPLDYNLYTYPLSQSWDMGTGRYDNDPQVTNGCSWVYTSFSGSIPWQIASFNPGATASYIGIGGGGVWYTSYNATQSFNYITSKDIEFQTTNIVSAWSSSVIPNYGFIVKQQDSLEYNSSSYYSLNYFSMDTYTIYPPHLEFRWDDFIFNTGSSSSSIITSDNIVVTLSNNKTEFQQNSIQKFRINVRDKYPLRVFQTSSIYLTNKYLPTSSYYSIQDLYTNETIIDFDNTYTKISADSTSNYFTIYMDGLEPERYYKILIKTLINGNTLILDDNYYFKVIS